jgi:acetyltransferase
LIVGSSADAQFGPVMLFGAGGSLVEVMKDRALGLPPLNTTLARRMIERTRIHRALLGVRGRPPIDMAALERLMVRFSQIVVEHREIKEIEINPLIVSAERSLVLDARVLLHPRGVDLDALPRLAIRPYPAQYAGPWTLKDGSEVTIRPIRPEDEPLIVRLHYELSEESVYFRYVQTFPVVQRTSHNRLARLCFIDYDREMALVVEKPAEIQGDPARILAVGRISRLVDSGDAEFSMVVVDDVQRQGVGTEVLRRLIDIARREGLVRLKAETLPENQGMKRVFQKLGFTMNYVPGDGIVYAHLDLLQPTNPASTR